MNARNNNVQEISMSLSFILLIVLILLLIGALPSWGYSRGWGYWPSGGLGLVLLIVIILVLMGRI
jgi:membrane protein YdbS with pleckstrin-like domain